MELVPGAVGAAAGAHSGDLVRRAVDRGRRDCADGRGEDPKACSTSTRKEGGVRFFSAGMPCEDAFLPMWTMRVPLMTQGV